MDYPRIFGGNSPQSNDDNFHVKSEPGVTNQVNFLIFV